MTEGVLHMFDDQIKRLLDKTFHEVNVAVKEVQKEKDKKKKKPCLRQRGKNSSSELKKKRSQVQG